MNNTSEKAAFLAALAADEDDGTTRSVFADWLDDHGEHEEADRHRKWPAAKTWMEDFCRRANPDYNVDDDSYGESYYVGYAGIMKLAREAVEEARRTGDQIDIQCNSHQDLTDLLREENEKFWKNFSILTGIPVDPGDAAEANYSCAC